MSVSTVPSPPLSPQGSSATGTRRQADEARTSGASGDQPSTGGHAQAFGDEEFSFWDLVDIVNPLQHIPVVSTLYREATGDQMGAVARIAGGALFGGPVGVMAALVNTAIEDTSGKDIGGHVVAALFEDDSANTGTMVAEAGTGASADGENAVAAVRPWHDPDSDPAPTQMADAGESAGATPWRNPDLDPAPTADPAPTRLAQATARSWRNPDSATEAPGTVVALDAKADTPDESVATDRPLFGLPPRGADAGRMPLRLTGADATPFQAIPAKATPEPIEPRTGLPPQVAELPDETPAAEMPLAAGPLGGDAAAGPRPLFQPRIARSPLAPTEGVRQQASLPTNAPAPTPVRMGSVDRADHPRFMPVPARAAPTATPRGEPVQPASLIQAQTGADAPVSHPMIQQASAPTEGGSWFSQAMMSALDKYDRARKLTPTGGEAGPAGEPAASGGMEPGASGGIMMP